MTDSLPDIQALRGLLEKATGYGDRPLPWNVWTSCSYRRVKDNTDRDVLSAYLQRSDNHPDLSMPEERLVALIAAINALPGLLDRIERLEGEREELLALQAEDDASNRNTERRAEEAEARAERMAEALLEGARWFDEYAELHLAKPDYDKAARNTSRAVYLRQALSPTGEKGADQ